VRTAIEYPTARRGFPSFDKLCLSSDPRWGDKMQFILATFLFVVVIGLLYARVAWPRPVTRSVER
jgi:hypothetical protein